MAMKCAVRGCRERSRARNLCMSHYGSMRQQAIKGGYWQTYVAPVWTKSIIFGGYINIKTPRGWMAEHRYVMERFLNRRLESHETVHHINGRRGDNRISNLELWDSSHPKGQRISDKLTWAIGLIERYGDEYGIRVSVSDDDSVTYQ